MGRKKKVTGALRICSIDAKDFYISEHYIDESKRGYRLQRPDGTWNYKRFTNSLDYSLDVIKMQEVYGTVNHYEAIKFPFSFTDGYNNYTTQVINTTYKYSVKSFNRINLDTYVKFGYYPNDIEITDCIGRDKAGNIVAVTANQDVMHPVEQLPKGFIYIRHEGDALGHYEETSSMPTLVTTRELREWLYVNGFNVDGVHFVRFKRSSGSARRGVCNFINQQLYSRMNEWAKCGLDIHEGMPLDLCSYDAYIALTSSSIIGTIQLDPKSILMIDDYHSVFKCDVMATEETPDHHYVTNKKQIERDNSIWDGQSLLDASVYGEYSDHCMLLLRNRFFKSACFQTNIQKFFEDNGITDISQLNGQTFATDIHDIKMITTPSSIKYCKFGTFKQWVENIDSTWGVVKYEKFPKYMNGKKSACHYQLMQTLQMTFDETKKFIEPTLKYIVALRDDPAILREHLKFSRYKDGSMIGAADKNEVVYNLMMLNDRFTKTKVYADFVNDLVRHQYNEAKVARIVVNGLYATLFGNGLEMLKASIGKFDGTSELGSGNSHCTRFEYGKTLIGTRSPHVTPSCVWLTNNVKQDEYDRYFNLTPAIVCINSIGESTLDRLSGADFDSDVVLLMDDDILVKAAQKNYDKFSISTSLVSSSKIKRNYSLQQMAESDYRTAKNHIGEIVNLAARLNSILMHNMNNGQSFEDNIEIYKDSCTLNAQSGVEIDSAKKAFTVDNGAELKAIREKYNFRNDDDKDWKPYFFKHIDTQKGFFIKDLREYRYLDCTMDYIQEIIASFNVRSRKLSKLSSEPISYVLDKSKYSKDSVNKRQVKNVVEILRKLKSDRSAIFQQQIDDKDAKRLLLDRVTYDATYELSQMNFNYSTSYYLIMQLCENPDWSDIGKIGFYMLLSLPGTGFYQVFDQSHDGVMCVEESADDYDSEYFGITFRHYMSDTGEKCEGNFDFTKPVDDILSCIKHKSCAKRGQKCTRS